MSCAVKRYNFLCLSTTSSRRGTKRKSSGHKHSGKFTPCPLSLMENKLAFLDLFLLQQKLPLCTLKKGSMLPGSCRSSQNLTSLRAEHPKCPMDPQELSRTTSLHLHSERKALPHTAMVANSAELAGLVLTAHVINT